MVLNRLQRWYSAHCDGEWEHRYGIRIETLDNPGWLVKIDLTGTRLAHAKFTEVRDCTDLEGWQQSGRWMHCRIADKVWEGAGDETQLKQIIETFLIWAEEQGS